jgi:TPR repeat protein
VALDRLSPKQEIASPVLEAAITRFDAGDQSISLKNTFVSLVDQGVDEANYFLGCIYEDGSNGVAKSIPDALFYYNRSIETLSYVEGYLAVARLLYCQSGVEQDLDTSFRYYAHIAEKSNSLVAQLMLGRMYMRGEGVEKNLVTARFWLEKSASQGSVHALVSLSQLESIEGRFIRSFLLRARGGCRAFLISLRNRRDMRLRNG